MIVCVAGIDPKFGDFGRIVYVFWILGLKSVLGRNFCWELSWLDDLLKFDF